MTQVNRVEFKNVIIDGTNRDINILSYSKENFAIYFSMQSVAQSFNELLGANGAREIFTNDFYMRWHELGLKCMTEFEIQLLVPVNLVLEPSTEMFNPMPISLVQTRYLNDKYKESVFEYGDYTNNSNDIFCIAERQGLTNSTPDEYHHKFLNSIGFLSFISVLKMRYVRKLYRTFFGIELVNGDDIDYIYETLVLNRQRMDPEDIANVFQLDVDMISFEPDDLSDDAKAIFVQRFNRACRVFKSFAFNLMDEQSEYISKNLQIITQFGMDRKAVDAAFRNMPKAKLPPGKRFTEEQVELLCRQPTAESLQNLPTLEVSILHSIIKIHLMVQRMTNVKIHKDDLEFYRKILRSRYSTDLEDLVYDDEAGGGGGADDDNVTTAFETINGNSYMVKNYTMGEIVAEFVNLYTLAQRDINTVWLCKFVNMACNPRYSNLVNIMADFVPCFQRFFTHDININSINNLIIFLQGMCRPDEQKINCLNSVKDMRQIDVRNFKTFSLSRYQSYNNNPLVTFIDLILTSRHNQKQNLLINMNQLSDAERTDLITLQDPNEQKFIDYIYDLVKAEADNNTKIEHATLDITGSKRFHLEDIDYDAIVPHVSTNTFNENNVTTAAMQLFNGICNQTTFFHELTNRVIYKVPGIVSNVVIK